jgi:hypothetical protein
MVEGSKRAVIMENMTTPMQPNAATAACTSPSDYSIVAPQGTKSATAYPASSFHQRV